MTQEPPKGDRIAKVLARAGLASRRGAEDIIAAGRVFVNGKRIDSPALNVTDDDRIIVDGKPLAEPEPERLWLYHKPIGLVTTDRDEKDRKTIYETLPEDMPRVMSVGRLDINSEGLLLLTNDGGIKRKLELPSTGWMRRYRVRINGRPTDAMLEPLRKGITVDGDRFQPMQITLDRQQGANAWLTVGLREGKNREIRRAMESIGLVVNRLIRISYGPFQLGDLKPGAVEEIRRRIMRDQLGLEPEQEHTGTAAKSTKVSRGPRKPASRPGKPRPGPQERRQAKATGPKTATPSGPKGRAPSGAKPSRPAGSFARKPGKPGGPGRKS
ncbi:pseudouridine synthase [Tateyamaria pelophila]|uniref:pseudouridine synthase n=1 Tax=Tateyamaria pelophila TaxID=328415 RepID=UPI001CBD4221|nr:pseudouridine synthase [Tateyamaria pelophila]